MAGRESKKSYRAITGSNRARVVTVVDAPKGGSVVLRDLDKARSPQTGTSEDGKPVTRTIVVVVCGRCNKPQKEMKKSGSSIDLHRVEVDNRKSWT